VTLYYKDQDTNALFDRYLASERDERDRIAEDLYERGKLLCLQIHRRRFQDVPIEVAEELFHEALMYVLEKGKPGKNFRAFLSKVSVHKTVNWLKKNRQNERSLHSKEEEFWARVLESLRTDPVDFAARELLERALDCISRLPERQRRTMQLFMEGFSYKDIGRIVPGSVKDHLFHARQNVRKCLKERYGWSADDFFAT